MNTAEKQEEILRDVIVARYGSLDTPEFSFVEKALRRRPYDELVTELTSLGLQVEETTDVNDDVSFCFALRAGKKRWSLQLSMVGPFAAFFRIGDDNGITDDVTGATRDSCRLEQIILDHLKRSAIEVLNKSLLSRRIPLSLFCTEKEEVRFYQALFSDVEVLPWAK